MAENVAQVVFPDLAKTGLDGFICPCFFETRQKWSKGQPEAAGLQLQLREIRRRSFNLSSYPVCRVSDRIVGTQLRVL